MKLFNLKKINLNIGRQILGLISLFFMLITYLLYVIYIEKKISIDFAAKEVLGNNYIQNVQDLYAELVQIRGKSQNKALSADLLKALDQAESDYGEHREMGTKETVDKLRKNAEKIMDLKSTNLNDFMPLSNGAISSLLALINVIGDQSNLILDPDLDSYYAMDNMLIKLPSVIDKTSTLMAEITQQVENGKELSMDEKSTLLVTKGEVASFIEGISASYNSMLKGSPDGVSKVNLESAYKPLREVMTAFLTEIDGFVKASPQDQKEKYKSLQQTYQNLMPKYFDFWKKTCIELDRLLKKRMDGFYFNMYKHFAISTILILLCFLFSHYIYRAVHIPIDRLVHVITKIRSENDYSQRIENVEGGEFGLLASSFNTLLEQIHQTSTTEFAKRNLEDIALSEISSLIQEISKGNMRQRINLENKQGFIYEVAKGLNQLVKNIELFVMDISSVMDSVSRYDLTKIVNSDYNGDFESLKTDVNKAITSILGVIKLLSQTTNQVAVTSSETSLAISQISDGAQTQMSAIDDVVKQLSMTVSSNENIKDNTDSASNMARESVKIALAGKSKMRLMVDIVNNIAENSAKINKITETIEKIANKTNLLSLNAAIEAARAGEHGKGFAVVADEVGKLASSAADSTQEISLLINEATAEAHRAVESVTSISQDMELIQGFIEENDSMLNKIASSIETQNKSLGYIQNSMKDLQSVSNNNAAASEEITSTAIDLAKIADIARKELNKFRT